MSYLFYYMITIIPFFLCTCHDSYYYPPSLITQMHLRGLSLSSGDVFFRSTVERDVAVLQSQALRRVCQVSWLRFSRFLTEGIPSPSGNFGWVKAEQNGGLGVSFETATLYPNPKKNWFVFPTNCGSKVRIFCGGRKMGGGMARPLQQWE